MLAQDIMMEDHSPLDDQDLNPFLARVFEHCGFDFRNYAQASLRRRLVNVLRTMKVQTLDQLELQLLIDPSAMLNFIQSLTVNTTSMFRDPSFYSAFRENIAPVLKTYPFVRLWLAGCATGEEAYSLSILLHEENLFDRCRIYATDVNPIVVDQAKEGIFPLSSMKEYSMNYLLSGGSRSLSNYYTALEGYVLFAKELRQNIVFAQHNLVSDGSSNEFHVILCRNVMIYFNGRLRDRVLSLFHDSLCPFGILALGSKESLRFSSISSCYEKLVEGEQIYRRVI